MSASERLRALCPPMALADPELSYEENARASFNATLALRNALPFIADVVEADETLDDQTFYALVNAVTSRFDCDREGRGLVDREGLRAEFDRIIRDRDPLTALREHLEGGDA